MRTKGSPDELEHRRRLAVQRCLEGYTVDEVAGFLGISPRMIWRRLASFCDRGPESLGASALPAPQAHRHPGEDRPAVVAREPNGRYGNDSRPNGPLNIGPSPPRPRIRVRLRRRPDTADAA